MHPINILKVIVKHGKLLKIFKIIYKKNVLLKNLTKNI